MSSEAMPEGLVTMIKTATRALVLVCAVPGETGPARVERLTGYSAGQISKWQNDNYPDIIPTFVVAELEFITQRPIVTRALAALTSHRLEPIGDDAVAPTAEMVGDLVAFAGSSARVAAELGDALADGVVTPSERKRIAAASADHQNIKMRLDRRLASIAPDAA